MSVLLLSPAPLQQSQAVYRLFDGGGRLLYVGVTNAVGRRVREHEESKEWWRRMNTPVGDVKGMGE